MTEGRRSWGWAFLLFLYCFIDGRGVPTDASAGWQSFGLREFLESDHVERVKTRDGSLGSLGGIQRPRRLERHLGNDKVRRVLEMTKDLP